MLFGSDSLICTIAELIRYGLARIDTDYDLIIRVFRTVALTVRKLLFADALVAVNASALLDLLCQRARRRITFYRLRNDWPIKHIYGNRQRYQNLMILNMSVPRPGPLTDVGFFRALSFQRHRAFTPARRLLF
jgi:hypothetical protein